MMTYFYKHNILLGKITHRHEQNVGIFMNLQQNVIFTSHDFIVEIRDDMLLL